MTTTGVELLECFMLLVYSTHACIDCACTICCLFPDLVSHPYLATMYSSIFKDVVNSEHVVLTRVLVYWAAAMSLVRALALVFRSFELCVCVCLMYVLEGLVAEYEGFSSCTVPPKTARMISSISFFLALMTLVFAWTILDPDNNPRF